MTTYIFLFFALMAALSVEGTESGDGASGREIKIVGDGGTVILNSNGVLYVTVVLKLNASGPVTVQPWWYNSYQIDPNWGNVIMTPVPISTMPPTNAPELRRLVVDTHWQSVHVDLSKEKRGNIWRLRSDAKSSPNIRFKLRYRTKEAFSNWEKFDLPIQNR
jgi:hypothetical protein